MLILVPFAGQRFTPITMSDEVQVRDGRWSRCSIPALVANSTLEHNKYIVNKRSLLTKKGNILVHYLSELRGKHIGTVTFFLLGYKVVGS